MNWFPVPQPQAYQVMPPQMPPNPFLGAARGMMQPPLPQGLVSIIYLYKHLFIIDYLLIVY